MTTSPDAVTTFADLKLRPELLKALADLGYEEPTPIQRESIPTLMLGTDLLGQAATGTGKTAAFALPILERLQEGERGRYPVALVLVPTRELAVQVSEAIHHYGKHLGARVLPIYGGQPIGRQLQALHRGVDVVVATPGRALDHINRETLRFDSLEIVVLDEADEMLDMGFAEELDGILQATPEDRQTVLFSATLPARIGKLAQRHLRNPERIKIEREQPSTGEAPRVRQAAYVVARAHKAAAIGRILDVEAPPAAIIFCRSRDQVDQLTESMNGRGYRAEALHGGMDQAQRDRVMGRLRNETADLLVATDVAARGLDIDHLTHVINYDVPAAVESYVHRIGRVGRAGRMGVAITLVEPREHYMLKTIERVTKQKVVVEKLPTISDMLTRRLDLTTAAIRESISSDDANLDAYRVVVDTLTDEFDIVEVALAAVKRLHELSNPATDEAEIPDASTSTKPKSESGRKSSRFDGERAPRRTPDGPMARLFINVGRSNRMRPQDFVGAIANESGLSGRDIGSIDIKDNFSLVDVPEASANDVIAALKRTTLKGRKVNVRRERFASPKKHKR